MEWSNFFYLMFGALLGSFLNVCIVRLPKEESIIWPSSHCRHCNKTLPWYDLIPILSYLYLLGRCQFCKEKISVEYPLIELITAFLALWVFHEFGFRTQGFAYLIFVSALLVTTVIDIHYRIIPDSISIGGTILGFLLSFHFLQISYIDSSLGILLGGGVLFIIAYLYLKFTGREGMGGGDIKLAAMIGAFLGYKFVFLVLFISSIAGSLVGIGLILIQRQDLKSALPFGPFLAVGALSSLFYGEPLLYWLGYF
ncbi:MAG: peptidase A24 [Deltaproteobacteria bacterium GWA2_38_16]|nr:MAG: peptidase A24 [Deltaproteobacteria bacterium GWA2_38_16]OGQ02381.1 MAG: peptidase A24 [Deltaproteobacteria bacterium RIFCSPHIGHO2_02_FULL_38_15]OGQ33045.1 MAG: peptidase A24 [Deltaproteobacteria bacterium RIFCSPLOWO2_01_FULL_38_9]OGQ62343.1 MAG: peptidase A24 [Deltaproteobacteria bacterium RIFCSPLOWO2_12_FULL_38_8]HBQ20716.1 prepilin peptidase [Deltaproteobacteria bacterium]